MFQNIVINRSNFPQMEVTLSSLREKDAEGNPYVDSEGRPFSFYWLTINGMICATGRKFTDILGKTANDESAFKALVANEDKFQIAQATDENGDPIFVNDDVDRPLLKIVAKAHSYTGTWG